uniref:Receptor expression-enhancing protein n=1 Tax=Timema genevievae TaxID=629358 RepID=A0A7R9PMH4_TIMGE|nr:unnamed protein product [Timema genevievae]
MAAVAQLQDKDVPLVQPILDVVASASEYLHGGRAFDSQHLPCVFFPKGDYPTSHQGLVKKAKVGLISLLVPHLHLHNHHHLTPSGHGKSLYRKDVRQRVSKEWKDTTIQSSQQAFLEGLSTGLKPPRARGPRFAMVHAGNSNGFVEGAELTFLYKKNTADAHDEMDGDVYEKWSSKQLLANTPEGADIVIDNAVYHSRRCEAIPTTSWCKSQIAQWLIQKNIDVDDEMLKREMPYLVSKHKHKFEKYKVDEMAKAVKDMRPLIDAVYEKVSVENCFNHVNHVKKIENDMWKADELQDDEEQFLIRLTSSSSSSPVSSPSPISPPTHSQNFELPGPSTKHYFTVEGATLLCRDSDEIYSKSSDYSSQIFSKSSDCTLARSTASLASVIFLAIYMVFGFAAQLFCNIFGFLYPAYASLKALETPNKEDDTKWLTYWVVFAFFSLIEYFSDLILSWFPFYWLAKCLFHLWCFIPIENNGSRVIYNHIIRPRFLKHSGDVDNLLGELADSASRLAVNSVLNKKDG